MLPNGCPYVKALIATHLPTGSTRITGIRCKRWKCAHCKRVNLRRLKHRLEDGKPTKFITLTARPGSSEDPGDMYRRIRPLIRRFIDLIRKRVGRFEHCIICERHESGFPHWHLLARSIFISQEWLSMQWFKITGSYVVHIRAVDSTHSAIRYAVKYIAKTVGSQRPHWLGRVYQFSQHWTERVDKKIDPDIIYTRSDKTPEEVFEQMQPHYLHSNTDDTGFTLWDHAPYKTQTALPFLFANCPGAPP